MLGLREDDEGPRGSKDWFRKSAAHTGSRPLCFHQPSHSVAIAYGDHDWLSALYNISLKCVLFGDFSLAHGLRIYHGISLWTGEEEFILVYKVLEGKVRWQEVADHLLAQSGSRDESVLDSSCLPSPSLSFSCFFFSPALKCEKLVVHQLLETVHFPGCDLGVKRELASPIMCVAILCV